MSNRYLTFTIRPEYPGKHVQIIRYPVDLLTTHDPLFKHGDDKQVSFENK